jgi:hypothetical protein
MNALRTLDPDPTEPTNTVSRRRRPPLHPVSTLEKPIRELHTAFRVENFATIASRRPEAGERCGEVDGAVNSRTLTTFPNDRLRSHP